MALTVTDEPTDVPDAPDWPVDVEGHLVPFRTAVGVLFPAAGQLGIPAGFTVDPDSVINRLLGLSFGGAGWALTRDTTVPITATETPGEFRIPVLVTAMGTAGALTASLTELLARLPRHRHRRLPVRPGVLTITPTRLPRRRLRRPPRRGSALDLASILDLAPEFELYGEGLGTIALDGTRAPLQTHRACPPASLRFRFWLTGQYEAGRSVDPDRAPADVVLPACGHRGRGHRDGRRRVEPRLSTDAHRHLPRAAPAGYELDTARILSAAFLSGLTFTATATGWTVIVDPSRAITAGASARSSS